ncbi:MAG: nucleoside-diphosphate sugar epimerase/dehydratase [Thermodesulfovibrionales bacterium]|nr:nucleoside-diphosphate sugar epimerase/dehydratase [Thermodesulfovibrionales bacterium]
MGRTMSKIYGIMKELIIRYRRIFVILLLLMQAIIANYIAFIIRFESTLPVLYLNKFLMYLPLLLLIRLLCIIQSGLHKGLWRYASVSDLIKIINSSTLGSVVFLVIVRYIIGDLDYPRSVYFLDLLLLIIISGGNRLFIRAFREYMAEEPHRKKILILGAGDAGETIVREMKNRSDSLYMPIGLIDDDPAKKGLTIHTIPILGGSSDIPEILQKYKPDEMLITSSNLVKNIKEIYEMSKPYTVAIKKLPGLNDILGGNISVMAKIGQMLIDANLVTELQVRTALTLQENEGGRLGSKLVKLGYISEKTLISFLRKHYGISHMKPISLEDLLQREPVNTNVPFIKEFIAGKSVMVTGAGGSIGSELCRQISRYHPSNLVLLDRYENSLFDIDLELRSLRNGLNISTVIGDIQVPANLEHIFFKHRPQIIFHAAAYKHVPLMEHNPIEAVKNNIFGTKNLIEAAQKYEADSFVLISTDKAVNPTNIMGATKRVAEFLTVHKNSLSKTKFTTVRFGNVLGTNGSVIPIFQEQLKKGGPLTVTHPDVERFFMLIPEAVHLVLTAASSGKGGEIFVLDMGESIRITDLAENFIRLAGFIPHKEIKIEFIGLRPGEKLYEELFDETEKVLPTFHKKLFMAVPEIPSMHYLDLCCSSLECCINNYDIHEALSIVQSIVPNFKKSETTGRDQYIRFVNIET